jgi:hypothetical protein
MVGGLEVRRWDVTADGMEAPCVLAISSLVLIIAGGLVFDRRDLAV